MAWPDIFFKAKKPLPQTPPTIKPLPEGIDAAVNELKPPTIKPLPAELGQQGPIGGPTGRPTVPIQAGTRTLPAMHGVVLRPPTRLTSTTMPLAPAPSTGAPRATAPLKNIAELMAEADPVSTLNQTGSLILQKKLTEEPVPESAPNPEPVKISAAPLPVKPEILAPRIVPPAQASTAAPSTLPSPTGVNPLDPAWTPPPFPAFQPAGIPVGHDAKGPEPVPPNAIPTPAARIIPGPPIPQGPSLPVVGKVVPAPPPSDTPFILKPAVTSAPKVIPPPPPPSLKPLSLPLGSVFRRRAKMTDLAKIVLPPKREDTQPLHPPAPTTAATVVPSAFPVAAMTVRASQPVPKPSMTQRVYGPFPAESVPPEKAVTDSKPADEASSLFSESKDIPVAKTEPVTPAPENPPQYSEAESPLREKSPEPMKEPEPEQVVQVEPVLVAEKPLAPPPGVEEKPAALVPDLGIEAKIDPAAHQPERSEAPLPKVDPEAHKPEPPAPKRTAAEPEPAPAPSTQLSSPTPPVEKREFHLANGERVAGVVLSETPEAVYLDHSTLGVLTIPRTQIAKRLVEIILINGDRVVGDLMAETADTLYVRHASLGMLTVPRAQRSTRVVEAILTDGDRILGEVLSETETFTVIRSATLGTITVPHNKVAMLNRKIEQIELKALPPSSPELKDKLSS